jgi:hypothetical protein
MPAIHVIVYEQNRKLVVKCELDCYDRAREEWWDYYEAVALTCRAEPDPEFD